METMDIAIQIQIQFRERAIYMGESDTLPRANGGGQRNGDVFDKITRFIANVGVPTALLVAMFAYHWYVGQKLVGFLERLAPVLEKFAR